MSNIKPCHICDNARLNDELTDKNDLHYIGVGKTSPDFRIMIGSGDGKPLRIEFEKWNDKINQWVLVGRYCPKYCPECGREIIEYTEAEYDR